MATGVVDIQRILARSKWASLAREVVQGAGKAYEADLLTMILQDIATLVQHAGEVGGFNLIVERHRAGILYAASAADLTGMVLEAYDGMYEARMAQTGRDTVIRQLRDHFAAIKQDREAREASTGQYL